jgi:hypothetical protein
MEWTCLTEGYVILHLNILLHYSNTWLFTSVSFMPILVLCSGCTVIIFHSCHQISNTVSFRYILRCSSSGMLFHCVFSYWVKHSFGLQSNNYLLQLSHNFNHTKFQASSFQLVHYLIRRKYSETIYDIYYTRRWLYEAKMYFNNMNKWVKCDSMAIIMQPLTFMKVTLIRLK